jgi:hypothetical protein
MTFQKVFAGHMNPFRHGPAHEANNKHADRQNDADAADDNPSTPNGEAADDGENPPEFGWFPN